MNDEVQVLARRVTKASVSLHATTAADSPGIEISLNTPRAERGNGWGVSATFFGSRTVAEADATARVLRLTLPTAAARRTLGAVVDAVNALDSDSRGDPFDAEAEYIASGAAATVITRTAAQLADATTLFASGATAVSPPVDIITEFSLTVGNEYRLQAQTTASMWITETPTADGAPDPETVASFKLPNFIEYYIEPEADNTIWVFAVGADGILGING